MADITTDPPADPIVDPEPQDPPATDPNPADPKGTPPPKPPSDPKERAKFFADKAVREENERLSAQLAQYKAADEQRRKDALTAEQRQAEEVEQMKAENKRLKQESLHAKVKTKYGLPEVIILPTDGDEDYLNSYAESIAALLPKRTVSRPANPDNGGGTQRIYTRAELAADPVLTRSPEVMQAHKEGRIR